MVIERTGDQSSGVMLTSGGGCIVSTSAFSLMHIIVLSILGDRLAAAIPDSKHLVRYFVQGNHFRGEVDN